MRSAVALSAIAAAAGVASGFEIGSKSNVAVYWGQNSIQLASGDLAQQRLSKYCSDPNIDVLILSFVTKFGPTAGSAVFDFANQSGNCKAVGGSKQCPEIEEDIATCQKNGKKIILSLGGATYKEGGFGSASDATAAADQVWKTFGPLGSGDASKRPFGKSSVDGIDFDFESPVKNMVPFAQKLRSAMDASGKGKYLLTSAPQCPFPDENNKEILAAVPFDIIYVQFYNNNCGLDKFTKGSKTQSVYNFEQWDKWAKTSKNPSVKIVVGAPADKKAAGSGYLPAADLVPVLQWSSQFASFGGAMFWDVSSAYGNKGFLDTVKKGLAGLKGGDATPPTTGTPKPPTSTVTPKPATKTTTPAAHTTTPAAHTTALVKPTGHGGDDNEGGHDIDDDTPASTSSAAPKSTTVTKATGAAPTSTTAAAAQPTDTPDDGNDDDDDQPTTTSTPTTTAAGTKPTTLVKVTSTATTTVKGAGPGAGTPATATFNNGQWTPDANPFNNGVWVPDNGAIKTPPTPTATVTATSAAASAVTTEPADDGEGDDGLEKRWQPRGASWF